MKQFCRNSQDVWRGHAVRSLIGWTAIKQLINDPWSWSCSASSCSWNLHLLHGVESTLKARNTPRGKARWFSSRSGLVLGGSKGLVLDSFLTMERKMWWLLFGSDRSLFGLGVFAEQITERWGSAVLYLCDQTLCGPLGRFHTAKHLRFPTYLVHMKSVFF